VVERATVRTVAGQDFKVTTPGRVFSTRRPALPRLRSSTTTLRWRM